jgi:O-antigen/teichoic acid export membrane protein
MSYQPSLRLSRNTAFAFATQALPMLAGVACVPVLVRSLGPERVGLLSMIWVVMSYFSVLDAGVSTAITRAVSMTLAGDDHSSIPSVFWSATALQAVMGAAGAIVLLAAAPAVATVLGVPLRLRAECISTIRICAVGLPVVLISGSVTGLLQAAGEFKVLAKYQAPCSIAQYLSPVVIALSGGGLLAIATVMVAIRLLSMAMTLNVARKLFALFSRAIRVSSKQIHGLLSFGFWVTVSSVMSPILVYIDRFLISNRLSLSAVAYYSVPLDAVMRLLLFSSSITAVLYPAFSGMSGKGDLGRTTSVSGASLKYILSSTGIAAVVLILFARDLLQKWVGTEFASHSTPVLRILLIGIVANALARVPYALLQSHGMPEVPAILQIASVPLQVLACLALMARFGLSGAAMAWSGRLVVETMVLFFYAHRNCGLPLMPIWIASRRVVFVLTVVLLVGLPLVVFTASGFAFRAMAAVAVTALGAGLIWYYALTSQDRGLVRGCLSGL